MVGGVIVTDDFLDVLHLYGKTSIISTVTAMYDVGCFFGAIASMVLRTDLVERNVFSGGPSSCQLAPYSRLRVTASHK